MQVRQQFRSLWAKFVPVFLLIQAGLFIGCSSDDPTIAMPGEPIAQAAVTSTVTLLQTALVLVDQNPHILVYDPSAGTLSATFPDGQSWTTELIDGSEDNPRGDGVRAVVDGEGQIHAAYVDRNSQNIRYVTGVGDQWVAADPLPIGQDRSQGLDIAVDLGGKPWIAYRNATTQAMEVVRFDGGAWFVETIDSQGNTGFWPRIASDLGGRMSVVYENASDGAIQYASNTGLGQWQINQVEIGSIRSGGWLDLQVRAGDSVNLFDTFPRLVFVDDSSQQLQYAYSGTDASSWNMEIIDTQFGGSDSCLAAGSDGVVWVTYLDAENLDLKVAKRTIQGRWLSRVVDANGATGFWTSCAVDQAGALHVAYASTDGNVYYRKVLSGF